jgi:hypothetical protein
MQADRAREIGKWCRRTATVALVLLVAYPLSIGPVYRIVHPTGRSPSPHRQYWAEAVPFVYQPLAFVCSKSWTAESTVCRYLDWWGEGPACGTYPK